MWGVPGPDRAVCKADARFRMAQTVVPSRRIELHHDGQLQSRASDPQGPAGPPGDRAGARSAKRSSARCCSARARSRRRPSRARSRGLTRAGLSMPSFDRAEAERLLDAVGWKKERDATRVARGVAGVADGTRLSIDFLHFPAFAKYGELMRQQLGAVGIDVTPRPLEPAVFAPTVFKDRNFDTNVISYCNGPDPEIGVRRMYHSSQIGPAPFTNAAAYRNDRVDALFDQAGRTVERDKRGASSTVRSRRSSCRSCRTSGWWKRRPRAPGRRAAAVSRRGQGSSRRGRSVSDRRGERPLPAATARPGRAGRRWHRACWPSCVIHAAPGDPVRRARRRAR